MRVRSIVALIVVLSFSTTADLAAQIGDGSLRGSVTDQQSGALPGVTVTATSRALLAPSVAVTDNDGHYRLINLPPGVYVLTAELSGFSQFRRENIQVRAGATFQVDIVMQLGSLQETITVSGEAPMLEVSRPVSALNVDATFQRALPLVESHFWTDFLQMTPGVISRPHNDGSGRQNYFGNGVEHREHVTQMEGLFAGNYNDFNVNRTGLSTEAIQDTQIKTGGVDAAAPMGYGLVINMISKSGGNQFSGSAAYALQPFRWNDRNTPQQSGGSGTAATRRVNQADFSVGGPIHRNRTWFFFSLQVSRNATTPGRTAAEVGYFKAFVPELKELPHSVLESDMPWLKVSTKLGSNHDLVGIYQADRLANASVRPRDVTRTTLTDTGGSMYGAKLTSVWGHSLTTTFAGNYNNKGGNNRASYEGRLLEGPAWTIHNTANLNQGRLDGSGSLLSGGNFAQMDLDTASFIMVRGDLTWFKTGWGGSHEFQTGFLAMPRNRYDEETVYLNNGFTNEDRRQIDPKNPGAGVVPFHRVFRTSALELKTSGGRDHDYGVYAQDTWKPTARMTATIGVRADFVKRSDPYRDLVLQSSTEIGPRAGVTYLLTSDAKNVLRSSWSRVHRQLMGGRDPVAEFGGSDRASFEDRYDLDGNGTFETVFVTPARTAAISSQQFDPDFRQPYIDEFILGYRRQFPGQISLDVAGITKTYHRQYSQVEINGFYPDGPFKPFGGFGRVDPNQGLLYRVTNNTWGPTKYRALQATIAKNMSRGFQAVATLHRQWQHLSGTWNPTDPARFIQPDAFPNDKNIWRAQGLTDHNSLTTGSALINNPIWAPYSVRLAGTWQAPHGIIASGSWTAVGGPWTGPIITQLAANDPQIANFGSATVVSSTGVRQSNPLATRIRFAYPTRGEGQVGQAAVHTVGLKLAKTFKLGGPRDIEVAANIFNLLNAARFTEWSRSGANRIYSPTTYLVGDNLQPARAYQMTAVYRF